MAKNVEQEFTQQHQQQHNQQPFFKNFHPPPLSPVPPPPPCQLFKTKYDSLPKILIPFVMFYYSCFLLCSSVWFCFL